MHMTLSLLKLNEPGSTGLSAALKDEAIAPR